MKMYRVKWEIDVDAADPQSAAKVAKWYHLHGDWSSVFEVIDSGTGEKTRVDLDTELNEEDWASLRTAKTTKTLRG